MRCRIDISPKYIHALADYIIHTYSIIGRPIGMTAEEVKGVWRHDQND